MMNLTDTQKLVLKHVWIAADDTQYTCDLYNEDRELRISCMSSDDCMLLKRVIEEALGTGELTRDFKAV